MGISKSVYKFREVFWIPAVLFQIFLLVNTRFTLWPEMVVYPYLINNKFLLYRDIINPYTPLLTYVLAFFARIFGYLPPPYELFTWSVIFAIDLLIFIVVRKITKNYYHAFWGLLFFSVFSVSFEINGLWFDLVQTPFLIVSAYLFYLFSKTKKTKYASRAFYPLVLTFFVKQQVIWFALFLLLSSCFLLKGHLKNLLKILIKPLVLFLLLFSFLVAVFIFQKTAGDFLFWTFYFPFFKASSLPGYFAPPDAKQMLVISLPFVIILALSAKKPDKRLWLAASSLPLVLFAIPRFGYFHLIPYLAVISIAIGSYLSEVKSLNLKFKLIALAALLGLLAFSHRYFRLNWQQPVRFFEQDVLATGSFIERNTPKNTVLFIQNGPDQILPISGRLPTKPWATQFPWYMETGNVEAAVLEGVKNQKPAFVVFKPYGNQGIYSLGSYKPAELAGYLDKNYSPLVKITDSLVIKVKNQ